MDGLRKLRFVERADQESTTVTTSLAALSIDANTYVGAMSEKRYRHLNDPLGGRFFPNGVMSALEALQKKGKR